MREGEAHYKTMWLALDTADTLMLAPLLQKKKLYDAATGPGKKFMLRYK